MGQILLWQQYTEIFTVNKMCLMICFVARSSLLEEVGIYRRPRNVSPKKKMVFLGPSMGFSFLTFLHQPWVSGEGPLPHEYRSQIDRSAPETGCSLVGLLGSQAAVSFHFALSFIFVHLFQFFSSFSRMTSLSPQFTWQKTQPHPGVHPLISIPKSWKLGFSLVWNGSGVYSCPNQLDSGSRTMLNTDGHWELPATKAGGCRAVSEKGTQHTKQPSRYLPSQPSSYKERFSRH